MDNQMTKEPIMIDEKLKEKIKQVVTNLGNIEFTVEDELKFCKKVLKRKEQECKELNNTITNLENTKEELLTKIDQLRAENQKLKELVKTRIEDLCDSCGASSMIPMPCKIYEQALHEIKDYCNKYPQNSIGFKKQIIQKCEDVL